jgi:hypothetical protein
MKIQNPSLWRAGILVSLFLFAFSLRADPIEIPERSVVPEIAMLTGVSILLEAICIWLLLRRFQKPRLFILWIMGMHLITYPAFMGLLWLLQDMRPALAAGIGEGIVVLVEGSLIHLICRFVPSAKSNRPPASLLRCLLASLAGNAVSAAVFPILLKIHDRL